MAGAMAVATAHGISGHAAAYLLSAFGEGLQLGLADRREDADNAEDQGAHHR